MNKHSVTVAERHYLVTLYLYSPTDVVHFEILIFRLAYCKWRNIIYSMMHMKMMMNHMRVNCEKVSLVT